MKKHMLKETNSMRRLMNLPLLKEEMESAGKEDKEAAGDLDEMKNYGDHQERDEFDDRESEVIGVDSDIDKQRLQKEQADAPSMEDKDKYCQKHFKCDYKDCDDKQKAQCDKECGKAVNEDSEGEETYNYGEDEGADEHKEDEMEDELHRDEEDMAPHDRIKAIEDHLDALKKDMSYDEDHEDRDEEGTNFAEGKRYSKVLNTLTESQYRRLKRFIK